VALYKTSDNSELDSAADSITFDIVNKAYVTDSSPPTVTLSNSDEVFDIDKYYDSNSITVAVKANNSWILKTKLAGNPTSGGDTIPVASNYYRAEDPVGGVFSNLASSRTSFAVADTYYNVAESNALTYTTGSGNGIDLDADEVTVIFSLKTTGVFNVGSYSTNATYQVTAPKP
jgi:hypothetical protein